MPPNKTVKAFQTILAESLKTSFPFSVLLIGLEVVTEHEFICPCSKYQLVNLFLTLLVFMVPPIFACALISFYSTFLKPKATNDSLCQNPLNKKFVFFTNLLIPIFVWLFILFLDGQYWACIFTKWEGHYVYDEKLKEKWCQPSETNTEDDLRATYQEYLFMSQVIGYALIILLCVVIFCVVSKQWGRNHQETAIIPRSQEDLDNSTIL